MKIDIVYPENKNRTLQRYKVIQRIKWFFLLAAYLCPIINLCVGGSAWSVIVLWGLWMAWSLTVSTDLVEYNRISQTIKVVEYSVVLLILIDVLLSPGWAAEVVYIVSFSVLIQTSVLFFTDLDRQKQNMFPILLLIALSIAASIVGMTLWKGQVMWPAIMAGVLALAFALACFFVLGKDFLLEFKKRFHTR